MDWVSCSASSTASARPSHGFATRSASASSSPPGPRAIASWPGPSRTAATTWVPCWPGWSVPTAEDKRLYDQAISDQEALLALDPADPENRLKLARYLNNLAILESRRDPEKAERDFHRALDLLSGLDPTRASLPGPRWQAARASNNLATLLSGKGREEEAERILKQARDALERLTVEFPRILQYRRELASIFNNLGRAGWLTKQEELAARSFRQAAELLSDLARRNPQVPDYQEDRDIALFQLGLLKAESDLASGERELAPLLAEQEKLVAAYPAVPDYRNALGRDLLEYGKLLLRRDQPARALPLIEQAVARFEEALKEDPGNRNYGKNLTEALTVQIMIAVKGKADRAGGRTGRAAHRGPHRRPQGLSDRVHGVDTLRRDHLQRRIPRPRCPRAARADAYGRRAVEILRSAVDRGLLHATDPLRDEEFVPLRTRPDFIDLIKELIERQKPVTG